MKKTDNSMKILQLPSWYLPEGGQFCRNQALFLQERGINVHILATVSLPWRKYKLKALFFPWNSFASKENGILTYRFFYRRIPGLGEQNVKRWCNRSMCLFEKYLKENGKPDIIHVHSSMFAGYVAYLIKKKYNIPYVITEHRGIFGQQSTFAKESFLPWFTPYLEKGFSNASCIIPVSSLLIPKIKEFLTHDVPIQVISNTLDVDFFHYKPCCKNDLFTFVSVNGFNHSKAYEILLQAYDILRTNDKKVSLRIVGENFEKDSFQKLLYRFKYKDEIVFVGEQTRDGVREELWNANSFVLPSRVEAQPVSVLEAINTGLPIVCTEVVPKEVVTDKVGYRVPIESAIALADAMTKMIDNYNSFNLQEISEHGRRIASPDVVISKLIDVYNEAIFENTSN